MKTVSDIMVTNILSVSSNSSIYCARMMMKDNSIRHLPVINEENSEYVGVLSQRSLLNHAFKIVEKYGLSFLEKHERQTPVKDVMLVDGDTAAPDMDLISAAEYFTSQKSSCLPVVENKKLQGIITSVDFVKLSLYLLKQA